MTKVRRNQLSAESELALLTAGFNKGSLDLEAWSTLFLRHLGLRTGGIQDLQKALGIPSHTFNKRLDRGYSLLAERLKEVERLASKQLADNPRHHPSRIESPGANTPFISNANTHFTMQRSPPRRVLGLSNGEIGIGDQERQPSYPSSRSALPARYHTFFVGRDTDVVAILSQWHAGPAAQPSIVAISGLGGMGKTSLAYEIASAALKEGRFDFLVWLSAKRHDYEGGHIVSRRTTDSVTLESILTEALRVMGSESLVELSSQERHEVATELIRKHSYLIVVDNLDTIRTYQSLVHDLHTITSRAESDRPSRVLLTSRERLASIDYVYDHYITGLSEPDALEFLLKDATHRRADGLIDSTDLRVHVYRVTRGMPLAMKLVVSQFILGLPTQLILDRLAAAKESELYEYIYFSLWGRLSLIAQQTLIDVSAFPSSIHFSLVKQTSRLPDDAFVHGILDVVRLSLVEPKSRTVERDRLLDIHPMTRWFVNSPLRRRWQRQRRDKVTT